jgi:hypothetical protein
MLLFIESVSITILYRLLILDVAAIPSGVLSGVVLSLSLNDMITFLVSSTINCLSSDNSSTLLINALISLVAESLLTK